MPHYHVSKSTLSGTISVPPSKSHTHRAILFAAMAHGTSKIHNFLDSPDTRHMIEAVKLLGAKVHVEKSTLIVTGTGGKLQGASDVIPAGNSGIILRFITAISALGAWTTVLTGDESIRSQRPILPLVEALEKLGAKAYTTRGDAFAPVCVQGPLQGGEVIVDGADSQFVSALLIACSFCEKPTTIYVKNPGEKPWVALTLKWLEKLGLPYANQNFACFTIPGGGKIDAFETTIPGDFSSAAFPLCAAAITGSSLRIGQLDLDDIQGDKKVIDALRTMGANIFAKDGYLHIEGSAKLQGSRFDLNDYIDALPALAVTACFADGETIIENVAVARTKECDRIEALATELRKMGAKIEELPDGLRISGSPLKGGEVDPRSDQRMVMALTIAALGASAPTVIRDVSHASKTFPRFAEHFQNAGANIEERT